MNICDKKEASNNFHEYEGKLYSFNNDTVGFKGIAMLCQISPFVWAFICIKSGNRIKEADQTRELFKIAVDVTDQYCLQKVK